MIPIKISEYTDGELNEIILKKLLVKFEVIENCYVLKIFHDLKVIAFIHRTVVITTI